MLRAYITLKSTLTPGSATRKISRFVTTRVRSIGYFIHFAMLKIIEGEESHLL